MSQHGHEHGSRGFGHRSGLNGRLDLGSILSMLRGSEDYGEPIAVGRADVLAHLEKVFKEESQEVPQELREQLEGLDDTDEVSLHETPLGFAVQGAKKIRSFEDLLKAATSSDRRGAGIFDELFGSDFEGSRDPFETLRARRGGREREPIETFLASAKDAVKEPKQKKERSTAVDIVLAAMTTATEMARYGNKPNESAAKLAGAFARLVTDLEVKDGIKFKNLLSYLDPYACSLKGIAERARQFSEEQTRDAAISLADELSRLGNLLMCVLQDARAKAKQVSAEAMNI